jgi:hypothetical protein
MKKFRFLLLALGVAAVTFAFTNAPKKSPLATYYAFDSAGVLLGSAATISSLKASLCPGADVKFCAQIWTGISAQNHPAGTQMADLKKPNTP